MCDRSHLKKPEVVTTIEWGFVSANNFGRPLECYVCGASHKAHGIAIIRRGKSTTNVPLCTPCAKSYPAIAIMQKFSKTPNLKINKVGELTDEELMAFADKRGTTEH